MVIESEGYPFLLSESGRWIKKKVQMHLWIFHKTFKLIVKLHKKRQILLFPLCKMYWNNWILWYNSNINSGEPEREGVGQHELHN